MKLDGIRINRAFAAVLLAAIAAVPGAEARLAPGKTRETDQLAFERAGLEVISLRMGETKPFARKALDVVTIQLICAQSDGLVPALAERMSSIGARASAETARLLIDCRGRAPPAA